MRAFAERVAKVGPAFFAVHGIDAGDALALATRFDCGWAYRGRQALFWVEDYTAHEVHDRCLPAAPLRPFDRRGLLEVRGDLERSPLTLIVAQFGSDRLRIRELRFVRSILRATAGRVLLFLARDEQRERIGFADLGLTRLRSDDRCAIYSRG